MDSVKETKELIKGLLLLCTMIVEVSKDGLQTADAMVILGKIQESPEMKALLLAAYNDVELVKEEMKDLDASKMIEIIAGVMPEMKDLIQAIVKKA